MACVRQRVTLASQTCDGWHAIGRISLPPARRFPPENAPRPSPRRMSQPDGISHLVAEDHRRRPRAVMSGKELPSTSWSRERHLGAAKVVQDARRRTFQRRRPATSRRNQTATRATAARCRRRAPTARVIEDNLAGQWSFHALRAASMPASAYRSHTSSTKTFSSWS